MANRIIGKGFYFKILKFSKFNVPENVPSSSPHLEVNGVLRYYKLCWNVLNSNISCTEAEAIPPHGRHYLGVQTHPKTY